MYINSVDNKEFGQKLYTWGFVLLSIKNITDSSELINIPEAVSKMLILAFTALMVVKLLNQRFSKVNLVAYVIIGALCTYTCFSQSYFYLMFSFFGIICLQDVDLKRTLKTTAKVKISFILLHVIVYLGALVAAPGMVTYSFRNGVTRFTFFLGHANTFSMYVTWATLELLYAYYDKVKIWMALLGYGVNILFYMGTNSNTSLIVITLALIFTVYDKLKLKGLGHLVPWIARYSYTICAVFFSWVCVIYSSAQGWLYDFLHGLDSFFTGRLAYGGFTYDTFGWTLLGQPVWLDTTTYWNGQWIDALVYDNSYIWMFTVYGALFMVIIAVLFIIYTKRMSFIECALVICFVYYGVMESYVINASLCFPILIIGSCMSRRKRKDGEMYVQI